MKSYLKILLMIILGLLVCDCTYAENGTETRRSAAQLPR